VRETILPNGFLNYVVLRRIGMRILPQRYHPTADDLTGLVSHPSDFTRNYCIVCQSRFRLFTNAGKSVPECEFQDEITSSGRRPYSKCVWCRSVERHRFLWTHLSTQILKEKEQIRLLHFAPLPGIQDRLVDLPYVDYVGVDLTKQNVDANCDIANLPFGDESFDVVICSHVLEHVPEDVKEMSELYRTLKQGGLH